MPGVLLPRLSSGLGFVLLGCLLLSYVAFVEARWLEREPWPHAAFFRAADDAPEGAREAWVRPVPKESLPPDSEFVTELRSRERSEQILGILGADAAEAVIMLPASQEELAALLDSGRLPEPGKPEALQGDLARLESFRLDGVDFTVVGRLRQSTAGFAFAYLVPDDAALRTAHFSMTTAARQAWFHETGQREALPPLEAGEAEAAPSETEIADVEETAAVGPLGLFHQVRTRTVYAYSVIVGLLFVAIGGVIVHLHAIRVLAQTRIPGVALLCREILAQPGTFVGLNIFLYGLFFFAMFRAMGHPLFILHLIQFVATEFTTGDLAYIGKAYASGEIIQAAAATFVNNYLVQTLVMTFLLSIVPLALGVAKTAFSFLMVGGAMSPIWTGSAGGYSYHSITMALELEAYIVACFVAVCWPMRLVRAYARFTAGESAAPEILYGLKLFGGGILATGAMLALAAFYEAATLILLKGI